MIILLYVVNVDELAYTWKMWLQHFFLNSLGFKIYPVCDLQDFLMSSIVHTQMTKKRFFVVHKITQCSWIIFHLLLLDLYLFRFWYNSNLHKCWSIVTNAPHIHCINCKRYSIVSISIEFPVPRFMFVWCHKST